MWRYEEIKIDVEILLTLLLLYKFIDVSSTYKLRVNRRSSLVGRYYTI